MSNIDCPSRDELSVYLLGKLSDQQTKSMTDHVDDCECCQSTVGDLGRTTDTLVSHLRRPFAESPYDGEPECRLTLELIQAIGRDPSFSKVETADAPDTGQPELNRVRDYRLLEKLGQGGMGTVYKALHTQLDKVVALKVLSPERMKDAQAVARFKREMKAVGQLSHPNIVGAFDAGEADGTHYLVMEYIRGIDLSELIRKQGPLPIADACELVRQAATGLAYAHQYGLVHRDINRANFMLSVVDSLRESESRSRSDRPTLKILDLGLARLQEHAAGEELTGTGQMMGTLDYMAPEQTGDSHDVDIRADIYSLGATLYKLLSGQAPYGGVKYNTAVKKIVALANEPVTPIQDHRPDAPRELAEVLERMLAKDADERFATPQEVADALAPLTNDADLASLAASVDRLDQGVYAKSVVTERSLDSTQHLATSDAIDTRSSVQSRGGSGEAEAVIGTSTPEPARPPVRPSRLKWVFGGVAAIVLLLAGGYAASIVVRVQFDGGVLELKIDDPKIETLITQEGVTIHDLATDRRYKLKATRKQLPSGEYAFEVAELSEGLHFETARFRITRDDKTIVQVTLDKSPAENVSIDTRSADIPSNWRPGPSDGVMPGLIPRPAKLPGIERWQIDTVTPRGSVYSVSYSPDGQLLACGSHDDNHIRVFNLQSGDLVRIFRMKPVEWGHGGSVPAVVAWCPDGKRLLGGGHGQYGGLHIWDTSSGELLRLIENPGSSDFPPVWSPDGKYIAVSAGWRLIVLDSGSGVRQFEFATPEFLPQSVAWSPDGKRLVGACSDRTVRVWSIGEDAPDLTLEGHGQRLWCAAWSPGGGKVASGGEDKRVIVWNAENGQQEKLSLLAPGNIRAIAWSPDGQHIACACDRGIRIWKAANGNPGPSLEAPGDFSSLAWRPDGRQMATVGGYPPKIRLWNARTGTLEREIGGPICGCIAWSPDGSQFATSAGGAVRLWDGRSGLPGKILKGHERSIISLAWKSDGSRLATAGDGEKTVRIWDPKTGTSQPVEGLGDHFSSLAWHPEGSDLIGAGHAGMVFRHRESGPAERGFIKTSSAVRSLAWSPDGQWIATALDDHEAAARIWNVTNGKCDPSLLEDSKLGSAVAFSPNGRQLAVSYSGQKLGVLELSDGAAISCKTWDHRLGAVHSIGWSPDGRWIAVGGQHPTSVKLWDVHVGEAGPVFPGGATTAGAVVAWSPDGTRIAVGSGDRTVRVWDFETQELLWVAVVLSEDSAAVFSGVGESIHADPDAEQLIVYMVERSDGDTAFLTPAEFRKLVAARKDTADK